MGGDMKATHIMMGVLTASACSPAMAQGIDALPPAERIEQPLPATQTDDSPAPTQAAEDKIEDIVVTATRREERLQKIPVTVTAVSGEDLTTRGITETRLLTQTIPGLNYARSGAVGQPVIRGVGFGGVSNGDESNVAVYIDGVYQPDPYSTHIELVQVARVEVLRGPQGTVFGRNATGGLINIITPDPSFTFSGRIAASYGRLRNNADDIDLRGYITAPLSANIAADLAVYYRDSEGYMENIGSGRKYGHKKAYDVRSKLLFEPSDKVKVVLTAGYSDYDSQDNVRQPLGSATVARNFPSVLLPSGPWQGNFDVTPAADFERFNVSLRTDFDLGPVNLATTSAYQYSYALQHSDSDATNIPLGAADVEFTTKNYSHEVRLLSQGSQRFDWIAGLYAFRLDSGGSISVLRATPPQPLAGPTFEPDVKTTSYAAFAEGTYQLADSLFLTLGGRFTTEKREYTQTTNGVLTIPKNKFKVDRFTYRAALRYQPTDQMNLYASYGTGFKSGAYNTVTPRLNLVKPEDIKATEVGVKADLTPDLRANLAVFRYDYTDLQVAARDAIGAVFILQNAADAEIYGGELEVTAIPVRGLRLTGSVAYLHARYTHFPSAQTFSPAPNGGNAAASLDVSGNKMIKAPTLTFNFAPRWEHDLGRGKLDIGGNLYRSSRVYYDFANRYSQPPFTMVNAEMGYEIGNVRVAISGTNLANKVVYQQIQIGGEGTFVPLERPREIKVGAQFRF